MAGSCQIFGSERSPSPRYIVHESTVWSHVLLLSILCTCEILDVMLVVMTLILVLAADSMLI